MSMYPPGNVIIGARVPFPPVRNSEMRALHVELRLVCGVDRDRLEVDHVCSCHWALPRG